MINLLDELVAYLGNKLSLTPGVNIFYNGMPDAPDICIALTETKHGVYIPPQIDASTQVVKVSTRAGTTSVAYQKATECYRWLLTSADTLEDPTGFIELPSGTTVLVNLHGNPMWEQTDQRGRRYYYFMMTTTTKRLI